MGESTPSRALAPEDLAKILGLHYDTVVRMLRRGEIPGRRVGRVWRTDPAAFQAWLRRDDEAFRDHPLISSNPAIMLGKPVIAGTRITVEHVMREIAGGASIDDLLDDHPGLTRAQVQAALDYGIAASAWAPTSGGRTAST